MRTKFTILELLMAMGIFVLAIIFVTNVFSVSSSSIGNARDESIAFELCSEGLEWFSCMGYNELHRILVKADVKKKYEDHFGLSINGGFKPIGNLVDDAGNVHQYCDPKLLGKERVQTDYINKKFARKIVLDNVKDSKVMKVTCQVRYLEGGQEKILEVGSLAVQNVFK